MNATPTIVRLLRFPTTLHLSRKGEQFQSGTVRSGPFILSERHTAIDVTFRVDHPGVTFANGGTNLNATEAFTEGEQRDVLIPWQLVVEGGETRLEELLLEIDVAYTDSDVRHTATVPLRLHYGVRTATVALGAALAVAAVAAGLARRRRAAAKITADDIPDEIILAEFDVEPSPRSSSSKKASSKKTSAKKSSGSDAKSASGRKTSTKKSSRAGSTKASGTRRESAASGSAQRKDGRGSSTARKSAPGRSTRKSR